MTPHEGQEPNPSQRRERLRYDRGLRKTQSRPETVDLTMKTGPRRTEEPLSTAAPLWQADMSLTETRETPPTTKQRMAENQGRSGKHPQQQQTLVARGKNSSKEVKKIQGAWTTKQEEPPSENNKDREGELPPKEGRNQDRTAALLPSLNKRQRKKPRREQQKERATRGQGDRMPHQKPHEHPIQEQQEGPKDSNQTTWPTRAGEGQAEKSEGG